MCHSVVKEPSSYVTHKRYQTSGHYTKNLPNCQQGNALRAVEKPQFLWKSRKFLPFRWQLETPCGTRLPVRLMIEVLYGRAVPSEVVLGRLHVGPGERKARPYNYAARYLVGAAGGSGMRVACQATARHSPLRFKNVPVLK